MVELRLYKLHLYKRNFSSIIIIIITYYLIPSK